MRYFMHLAYMGKNYSGWQRQKANISSVQGIIEEKLSEMTKTRTSIMGCGRTDAGVHAAQYFCHFDYQEAWTYDPVSRLNLILPKDISIYDIVSVDSKSHSRFDAFSRTYKYFIHSESNPFIANLSTFYDLKKMDIRMIELGLKHLQSLDDFYHLCLAPDRVDNTRCNLIFGGFEINPQENRMCFTFTANRFLRSMIRMLVARLLALGQGIISLEEFKNSELNNTQFKFKVLAYPQGLYLTKVEYPYLSFETKSFSLV